MCHFALVAQEEGLSGVWTINDPRLGNMAAKLDYMVTWTGSTIEHVYKRNTYISFNINHIIKE